jgi:KDO2-lipid IV(A) lauroyltransferase
LGKISYSNDIGGNVREKIEYALVKLLLWIAKVLPRRSLYSLVKALTLLVYRLDSKRRMLTVRNLAMAFPQKTKEEIESLAKEVYVELSKTITEILLMFTGRFDIDAAVINQEEAQKKLTQIIGNSPNGVIIMTAHFSNWELGAHFLAKHGLPALAIGRKGNNALIDQYITIPFRNKYGNKAISKSNAMIAMAKRLRNGEAVGLLIDQKAGAQNSAKVDFFGMPAETTLSVAMLKLKFDPLVVPVFIAREEDGRYRMIINDPIAYTAEEIEDKEEKMKAMTAKYTEAIETVVRAYPSQWFWMHNRWRR